MRTDRTNGVSIVVGARIIKFVNGPFAVRHLIRIADRAATVFTRLSKGRRSPDPFYACVERRTVPKGVRHPVRRNDGVIGGLHFPVDPTRILSLGRLPRGQCDPIPCPDIAFITGYSAKNETGSLRKRRVSNTPGTNRGLHII